MSCARETTLTSFLIYLAPLMAKVCLLVSLFFKVMLRLFFIELLSDL